MFKIIKNFFKEKSEQKSFLYCTCGNEMISDGSFQSDTLDENKDNHVIFKCKECDKKSDWNFDIAPVAVNWDTIKKKK